MCKESRLLFFLQFGETIMAINLVPASVHRQIESLGIQLEAQRQLGREKPLVAVVNTIALAALGFAAVSVVSSAIAIPLITPVVTMSFQIGIAVIMNHLISQALEAHRALAAAPATSSSSSSSSYPV